MVLQFLGEWLAGAIEAFAARSSGEGTGKAE